MDTRIKIKGVGRKSKRRNRTRSKIVHFPQGDSVICHLNESIKSARAAAYGPGYEFGLSG